MSESYRKRPAANAEATQEAAVKRRKLDGGTGVYFQDTEVKFTAASLHPLQSPYRSHTMYLPTPTACPEGQPLYAPPILATTLQGQDSEEDGDDDLQEKDVAGARGLPAPATLKFDPRLKKIGQKKDQSCEEPLFSERRRTALRQHLRSRDYRLSTDEQEFIEAAVILSNIVTAPLLPSVEKKSTNQPPLILTKPQLPLIGGVGTSPPPPLLGTGKPRAVSIV